MSEKQIRIVPMNADHLEELERLWHSYDVYQSVEERTDTE